MKNKIILGFILGIVLMSYVYAADSISTSSASVCCEKTTSGLFCQNVPASECAAGVRQVPSACSSTSFCQPGTCYNSFEGTCLDNTPQNVCNANNGTWSLNKPASCNLGCCILGDQAAFVSLVRCKRLSGSLGLVTNYKKDITNEVSCVLSVQNQDRGACVYDFEFEKTCKFTTRAECNLGIGGSKGDFYKDKLCTDEELGTNCGPTKDTTCVVGKDEVYFKDSCGNPANIYDSSKVNDKSYWTNVMDKSEVCGAGKSNAGSASCGNCNYPLGSICRATETGGAKPTYGNSICTDLNCYKTQNGNNYKHGESWCVFNDYGTTGQGKDSVGSRFYKHICVSGEEVLEQCADFRQEECIQSKITTSAGDFSQAGCRVNRWQDCLLQTEQIDCENTDKRDCYWKGGIDIGNSTGGACLPKNSPGLKFWDGEEAKQICAQANAQCLVTFEKGLFGGESCKSGCECISDSWTKQRSEICSSLGDCGPSVNWIGVSGYKSGYNVTTAKA